MVGVVNTNVVGNASPLMLVLTNGVSLRARYCARGKIRADCCRGQ